MISRGRTGNMKMRHMAYRNLLGRMFRTILMLLAVAIAVALFVGLSSLTEGMEEMIGGATESMGEWGCVDAMGEGGGIFYGKLNGDVGKTIDRIPGVRYVVPRVYAMTELKGVELKRPVSTGQISGMMGEAGGIVMEQMVGMMGGTAGKMLEGKGIAELMNSVILIGIDPTKETIIQSYPTKMIEGSIFDSPIGGAVIGKMLADESGLGVGDEVRVAYGGKRRDFNITGIYEVGNPLEDEGIVVSLRDARDLKGLGRSEVSIFRVIPEPHVETGTIGMWIKAKCRGVSIMDQGALMKAIGEQIDQFKVYEYILEAIVILASFGFILLMTMRSIAERTREIGTLRAIGWQKPDVLRLITMESTAIAIIGTIIGIIIGILLPYFFQAMMPIVFPNIPVPPMTELTKITSATIIYAFIIGCTSGIIGGIVPALQASEMSPVDAFRAE